MLVRCNQVSRKLLFLAPTASVKNYTLRSSQDQVQVDTCIMAQSSQEMYKNKEAAVRSFRQSKRQFFVMKSTLTETLKSVSAESVFVIEEYVSELKTTMKKMQDVYEFITQSEGSLSEDPDLGKQAESEEEQRFCELVTCQNELCVITGTAKAAIIKVRESGNQELNILSSVNKSQAPKIQKLNIPKIDGERKNWTPFKELFVNLIHNDINRSGVEKLSYLKEAMVGKVEDSLKDVQLTEAAYLETWERLCGRYDNVSAIVQAHFKDLFKVERIKYESQLPELLDNFEIPLRNLKASGEKTDDWSSILAFMLYSGLDSRTQREFENSIEESNKKFYSYDQLRSFVSKRAIIAEEHETERKLLKSNTDRKACNNTTKTACCAVCKSAHRLFECEKFLALSSSQRYEVIKKNRLCGNCFSAEGHMAKDCRSARTCRTCGKKHHTLLHSESGVKPRFEDASLKLNEVHSNSATGTSLSLIHISEPTRPY